MTAISSDGGMRQSTYIILSKAIEKLTRAEGSGRYSGTGQNHAPADCPKNWEKTPKKTHGKP